MAYSWPESVVWWWGWHRLGECDHMSMLQHHAYCVLKTRRRKRSQCCTVWADLVLWEQVGLQVFPKSFLELMHSLRVMSKLFHGLGVALDSKVLLLLFPWLTWGMWRWNLVEDCRWQTWRWRGFSPWRYWVLGLCCLHSCTWETGSCSQCAFQQVASVAWGMGVMWSDRFESQYPGMLCVFVYFPENDSPNKIIRPSTCEQSAEL